MITMKNIGVEWTPLNTMHVQLSTTVTMELNVNNALQWYTIVSNEHPTHAMNVQLSTMHTYEYNDYNGTQWLPWNHDNTPTPVQWMCNVIQWLSSSKMTTMDNNRCNGLQWVQYMRTIHIQ